MDNEAYSWLFDLIQHVPGAAGVVSLQVAQLFGIGLTAQGVMYALDRAFTGTMPGQEAVRAMWWPRLVSRVGPILTVGIGAGVAAAHNALGEHIAYGTAMIGGALSPFTFKATHELVLPAVKGMAGKFKPAQP